MSTAKNGSVGRRCSCRDPKTGKSLGHRCTQLTRRNPDHGQWFWRLELPADADGNRRPRRRAGFTTETDAQSELDHALALLALPDRDDADTLTRIGDAIEHALTHKEQLPTVDELRRRLRAGDALAALPTVGEWLAQWLPTKRALAKNTVRSYESHIRLYLTPHLGHFRLDRLKLVHLADMYEAIDEFNDRIREARASNNPKLRAKVKGRRTVGPASQQRIRATLRAALNDAKRQELITYNPAEHFELPPGKRPKPLVWTPERVARWEATGDVPGPVMVWTPQQTGRFLDHALGDRLYALFHLIAFRGLRRGEACGVHWSDTNLDAGTMDIRWQILQLGWDTELSAPKTDDSDDTIALDTDTIAVLRTHQEQQEQERKAFGSAWPDTDLVFTQPNGVPLHPAKITDHFRKLTAAAGLPPIRLHDLRHGTATLALAAGVDMKTIQQTLRHSSITITADTYTTVLPELARAAADALAHVVPRRAALASPSTAPGHAVPPDATPARPVSTPVPSGAAQGHVVTVIDHNQEEAHDPRTLGLPLGAQETTVDGEHDHE